MRSPNSSSKSGLVPNAGNHGGDGQRIAAALGLDPSQILDLSQSLNPFAPDIAPLVARNLDALGHYPSPASATELLADTIGVDPSRLLLTNGGSEAISLVAAEVGGSVRSEPEFGLHPRGAAGPIWRSNPHSPSGRLASDAESADVWDEAFYPLATGSWTAGRSGIVVGSLTKVFACPGLRLGYVIADDIEPIAHRQPHWAVSSLALAVLPAMLETCDLPRWSGEIRSARQQLFTTFASRGYVVEAADGPWVLVHADQLRKRLAPHGVVVRDCASFGMPGVFRVAVPNEQGHAQLERALDDLGPTPPTPPTKSQPPDVRAIVFDIGDTLVHAAPAATPVDALQAVPIGDSVNELRELCQRFQVAALTDTSVMTSKDVREALSSCGLAELLEVIVTSVDVGAAKPDPRGLHIVMDRLGVTPEQTLFVGDSDVDEGAANAAGTFFVRAGGGRSPGGPVAKFLDGSL